MFDPGGRPSCIHEETCAILGHLSLEARMKEVRKVHYVKGVFVCPSCRQSYVQEKWIEAWRVRRVDEALRGELRVMVGHEDLAARPAR